MKIEKIVGKNQQMTKTSALELANQLIEQIEEGDKDPLTVLGTLQFISIAVDEALSRIRKIAVPELEKYGKENQKGIVKNGITFRVKETGVRYNYESTAIWNELNEAEKAINEKKKELEARLKLLKSKETILNEETGEMIELFPASKSSTTTVEISIPK